MQIIRGKIPSAKKVVVYGPEGIGKSTLLKTLNGNIPKLKGEFEYGYHVQKGYFDQQMEFLNPENTIFEEIAETFPELTTTQVRTLLGTFLFTGEDVFKKIKVLSGGERGRLQLCKILKKQPNVLLLDEPTNHMDIVGKESLENILKEYTGTLIFVSHDRYFVNKLADCILEFDEGKVTFYHKNYQEFLEYKENQEGTIDETKEVRENTKQVKDKKKETNPYFIEKEKNRIQNKMNKIEQEINDKEKKIQDIEKEMLKEDISSDYIKLNELQKEIQKINQEIEEKMQEWENLNDEL